MKINIKDVMVKKRVRKNLGDIIPLAESMKQYGLLNPIIVDKELNLIAGERRLEAARKLGWSTIEAVVLSNDFNKAQTLEIEIDENLYRKPFTPDELADGIERLEKLRNPGFFRRILLAIQAFFSWLFRRRKPRAL
ncbi:MAG: ParB N-terminal domain-containing protein [Spirochaetales bacterium]|nr:ParB N-terminal domain-containing protein [Spirochaetales bacterium]